MSIPVSISICTRNRARHLRNTLCSVNSLSVPEHLDPELLVVDNGSTDATSEVMSDPPVENMPVRRVVEPETGVARARNTALREANGRILLWLDDDVRVPPNWLTCMTQPILEGKADAVAGKVTLAPSRRKSWMESFHRTTLASTESIDPEAPKNIVSANMAFDRAVLADVPGFDRELGPGSQMGTLEDTLFSWQLRTAGYRIEMVTETAVEHHFDKQRLTRDAFVRAAIARGRSLSYIRYHWLHHTRKDWTHRDHAYQIWRQPRLMVAKRLVDWNVSRWMHWLTREKRIDKQEFWNIMNLCNTKQYLTERTRPRNYEERGLNKLHGEQHVGPPSVHHIGGSRA